MLDKQKTEEIIKETQKLLEKSGVVFDEDASGHFDNYPLYSQNNRPKEPAPMVVIKIKGKFRGQEFEIEEYIPAGSGNVKSISQGAAQIFSSKLPGADARDPEFNHIYPKGENNPNGYKK